MTAHLLLATRREAATAARGQLGVGATARGLASGQLCAGLLLATRGCRTRELLAARELAARQLRARAAATWELLATTTRLLTACSASCLLLTARELPTCLPTWELLLTSSKELRSTIHTTR